MTSFFKIGKLIAAHGLKGELILQHALGNETPLEELKVIFIEENKNSFLPWFIRAARIKNEEELYLKLESVDTRESALKMLRKNVWLPENDFKRSVSKSAPINYLGFRIIHEKKSLGEVLEVIEQPHQVLCRIDINNIEVLIPLNEGTLQKIDHRKKEIHVQLPDGLLEVYL